MSAIVTSAIYHVERIEGHEVQKPLPKKFHAIIQSYLIAAPSAQLSKQRYRVLSELNMACGVSQRDRVIPDVTVALRNAEYRDGDLFDPAALCVEIMSPGQTLSNLLHRAEHLLEAKTPVCWIIWPERRQAWSYTNDGLTEVKDILTASLVDGPSMEIPLALMWAELD